MTYIATNNTNKYIPTENYHPATKKYVDENTYTVLEASTSNIIDFNTLTTEGLYFIKNLTTSTTTNAPSAGTSGNVFLEVGSRNDIIFQSVMTNNNGGIPYHRQYSSGAWSSWLSTIATSVIRVGMLNSGTTCADPTESAHIANKNYVDTQNNNLQNAISVKATKVKLETTIPTTGWTSLENGGSYVSISNANITVNDDPHINPKYTTDESTNKSIQEAWNKISRIETKEGYLYVYAYGSIPTIEIPIQLEIIR